MHAFHSFVRVSLFEISFLLSFSGVCEAPITLEYNPLIYADVN